MNKYKYLLFDWDGCLARTLEVWLDAYKQVFSEFDIHPTDKEITSQVFGDWNGPIKLGISSNDIEKYTEKLLKIVNHSLESVELYENVLETILKFHQLGKKLAILTTSKISTLGPALIHYDLRQYFDIIITAEDVKKHKPDPEIIEIALKAMGGVKAEAIIIGDSKSDLGAAKNAGVDSVLFYPKSHKIFYDLEQLKTYQPTFIVKNFNELALII